MDDIYKTGYGNRFPDSNILSAVVPFIHHSRELERASQDSFRILDLGCGLGSNLYILNEFIEVKYQGIDINETAIEIAKTRIQEMELIERAQVEAVSTEKFLEVSNHRWELILDRASLQHHDVIQDKFRRNALFSRLNSRLASGGAFVSLWAGARNADTKIRFENFVPFEDVKLCLEASMNVVSIRKISQYKCVPVGDQLLTEEFLVVAKRRSNCHD